jgi:hypothetical protein
MNVKKEFLQLGLLIGQQTDPRYQYSAFHPSYCNVFGFEKSGVDVFGQHFVARIPMYWDKGHKAIILPKTVEAAVFLKTAQPPKQSEFGHYLTRGFQEIHRKTGYGADFKHINGRILVQFSTAGEAQEFAQTVAQQPGIDMYLCDRTEYYCSGINTFGSYGILCGFALASPVINGTTVEIDSLFG